MSEERVSGRRPGSYLSCCSILIPVWSRVRWIAFEAADNSSYLLGCSNKRLRPIRRCSDIEGDVELASQLCARGLAIKENWWKLASSAALESSAIVRITETEAR